MTYRPEKVPLHIGFYLAGFADGEGSFKVSFRKRKDCAMPWRISLSFKVTQEDKVIPALFKRQLACGTLRSGNDGIWYYQVDNHKSITGNVIPFFRKFGFLSAKKKRDFSKFRKVANLIDEKEHLDKEGIREILKVRSEMNDGGKRKYSDKEILATIS